MGDQELCDEIDFMLVQKCDIDIGCSGKVDVVFSCVILDLVCVWKVVVIEGVQKC